MINTKNKKGVIPVAIAIVLAVALGIVFLTFFAGGGISATYNLTKLIYDITQFLKQIPTFIWVILGVVILLRVIGGGRRRR